MALGQSVRWSEEKNQRLKTERGLSFEAVLAAIEGGQILDDLAHPNPERAHQRVLMVEIDGYACGVPYVRDDAAVFLKTAYRSRVFQERYLRSK